MAARKIEPLYYAMVRLFTDGHERSVHDVVKELKPIYGDYKMLTFKYMEEALATAKENGLLDETGYAVDENKLIVRYLISEFGSKMVDRYLS